MANPLDDRAGKRAHFSPDEPEGTVPHTGEKIGAELFGPEDPRFSEKMRNVESNAEDLLRAGHNYTLNDMDTGWNPFTLPLRDLNYDKRREFRARIDELTKLTELIMNQGQGPRMFRPEAGRMLFGEEAEFDPRRLTIEQQTVRFMNGEYGSSGTHLRQDVIEHLKNQLENGIPTHIEEIDNEGNVTRRPVKTAVIDVESPGLKKEEGIWQFSLRMMEDGEQVGEHITRQVSNPKMNWAAEYGPNRQNFDDFLRSQGKPVGEFEDSMREFLDRVDEADYIAGHNLSFDFNILQHGLRHTPAYTNDPEFRSKTDAFISKFYDTKTGKINDRWIDTAQHARHNLPDLEVAEELKGTGTTHSLTNILLQTDLMGRIKEELGDAGEDKINEQLRLQEAGGLHDAGVDTFFESHLNKYLQEGREGGRGLKIFPSGEYDEMTEEQRAAIVHSLPITPNLPFTTSTMQNPIIQEKARAAGLIEGNEEYLVSPLDNMIISSRYFEEGDKSNIAPENPISWLRNMYSKIQIGEESSNEVSDIAGKAGIWNDIFGGNVVTTGTKEGMISQSFNGYSPEEWRGIQEDLKAANIPFHGLDPISRHLTAAQGVVNAGKDTEGSIRKAFGGDVAPILKIFGAQKIAVKGNSKIATIPLHVLQDWERERIDNGEEDITTAFTRTNEAPQFVGTSFFRYGEQNKEEVAYTVQVPEIEKTSLLEYLKRHPTVQEDEDLASALEESFANNTGAYGVQIGTLTGFNNSNEARRFRGVVEQIQGEGRDFSDQTPHFYSSLIGSGKDGSIYLTGAFRQTELLSDKEKKNIANTGTQVYENFEKLKNSASTNAVREAIDRSLSKGGASAIRRTGLDAAYSMVRRNAPIIGIGASLAGLGYYKHRKDKEEKQYADTMALQPTSPNPRNQQYGLVQRLDNNKIGHTKMGPSKHDQLFNGAY